MYAVPRRAQPAHIVAGNVGGIAGKDVACGGYHFFGRRQAAMLFFGTFFLFDSFSHFHLDGLFGSSVGCFGARLGCRGEDFLAACCGLQGGFVRFHN